jgi:uncharacterized protein (TIGR03437 family)
MVGVYLATVQVPSSARSGGAIPIVFQVGTSQSQAGVTIAIQ